VADTKLVFDIIANDKTSGAFGSVASASGTLEGKLGGMTGKMHALSTAAGTAAGSMISGFAQNAIGAVSSGIGTAITAASDMNETINKSNVIFGGNAKEIEKWANSAAKNVGLSKSEALDAAAGFGDMFKQLGFAGDTATKMSTSTVQLAADLGSFNNMPTADVSDKISAAFRGEYDSLQALIPNINAARVEKEALAETGKKTAASLTAQEKAQAVLTIVQQDGSRAVGDFARTSDGLANSQKILSAQQADMSATLGQILLPIMGKFTQIMSQATTFIMENKNVIIPLVGVLGGLAAAVVIIIQAQKAWAAAQVALNVVMSANPIALVVLAIAGLIAIVVLAYKNSETFRNIVDGAFTTVKNAAAALWGGIKSAFDLIMGAMTTVKDWIITAVGVIVAIYVGLPLKLIAAVGDLFGFLRVKATAAAEWLGDKVGAIVGFYLGMPGRIVSAVGDVFGFLKTKATAAAEWISDKVGEIVGFYTGLPGRIVSGAGDVFKHITQKASDMKTWVSGIVSDVVGFFTGIPGKIAGSFSGMFNGIGTAFRSAINSVISGWNNLGFTLEIPSVRIPGTDRQIGGGSMNFSPKNIPMLAAGGIVMSPTLAMIGEAGPEAVIPLSRGRGMGGTTIHIGTLSLPNVVDGPGVVAYLQDYSRRNGPIRGVSFA